MRWFRVYAELIFNPKLKLLAFEDRWHFVAICCLKCDGLLDKEHHDAQLKKRLVATQLGLTVPEADEVKMRLVEVDLIDDDWQPRGWGKYQSRQDLRPSPEVWRVVRQSVFERDDFTCVYCGVRGVRLECDHILPVSRGGKHDPINLATACFVCNRSKRDKLIEEWMP